MNGRGNPYTTPCRDGNGSKNHTRAMTIYYRCRQADQDFRRIIPGIDIPGQVQGMILGIQAVFSVAAPR